MNHRDVYIPGPCSHCGKPGGGTMGSSSWGHDYYCCSDKCGAAFASTKKRFHLDLQEAEADLRHAKAKVESIRRDLASATP